MDALKTLARRGLRTLVLSRRILSQTEYNQFDKKINLYVKNLEDRE